MDKRAPHPLFKLATELGPLLIFFAANAKFNLFVATGAFMVAIVVAVIASYVVVRHVPLMALVTAVIVLVFGGLTLVLHDETFIKIKPTIIYALFALTVFVAAMAVLNEIIWRTQSTDFWVACKALGVVPLTMVFAMAQMPLVKRYHIEEAPADIPDSERGDISP